MTNYDLLDREILDKDFTPRGLNIELITVPKFIILSIATFGVYLIWWMYKSWSFFKRKDNLNILPVGRAIFGILYAYALFESIQTYAKSKGYDKQYSTIGLTFGFIAANLLSRLPDPFWLISMSSFIFIIPPLKALNFAIRKSDIYSSSQPSGYNTRQIVLLIIGTIFTLLAFLGLAFPE